MLNLRRQRRNTCSPGQLPGTIKRRSCRSRLYAPHCDPCAHQLVDTLRGRRKSHGINTGERAFGLIETANQQQMPDLQIARMGCIHAVAMRFERGPCGIECLRRPTQIP